MKRTTTGDRIIHKKHNPNIVFVNVTFIRQFALLKCMEKQRIVPFLITILLIAVSCSGCINSTSEKPQIVTPTQVKPAVELHMKGFDAYINGDFNTALDFYDKALAADPTYTGAWIDKGNVLIRLNRSSDAVSAYDSALAINSQMPEIWNSRGEALMTLGKYAEALDSFDKALTIVPDYPQAKENRNLTLEKLK